MLTYHELQEKFYEKQEKETAITDKEIKESNTKILSDLIKDGFTDEQYIGKICLQAWSQEKQSLENKNIDFIDDFQQATIDFVTKKNEYIEDSYYEEEDEEKNKINYDDYVLITYHILPMPNFKRMRIRSEEINVNDIQMISIDRYWTCKENKKKLHSTINTITTKDGQRFSCVKVSNIKELKKLLDKKNIKMKRFYWSYPSRGLTSTLYKLSEQN